MGIQLWSRSRRARDVDLEGIEHAETKRTGVINALRISKRDWYANGGFQNSRCWRRHQTGRGWQYFMEA